MNEGKIIFSKFLKKIRMKKNLTQEELSNLSYINLKTISNMENGNTNYDLDTLETLSTILKVDLIDKYFDVFYGDSHRIDSIIKSFNEKDMIYGASLDKEINELVQIKDKANRNIIKLEAEKLILFFKGMEEKDKIQKRQCLISKALNINGDFDFKNLESNYYENIDYRILMSYASTLDKPHEKLKIYKFIENSNILDQNINSILYTSISYVYNILENSSKALEYIEKALSYSLDKEPSPVMLYTKALILKDLSLPYDYYIKKSLEIAKKQDIMTYQYILDKINVQIEK